MMKTYNVNKAVTLTVQPGSQVILTDAQAAAAHAFVMEVKKKLAAASANKPAAAPEASKTDAENTTEG